MALTFPVLPMKAVAGDLPGDDDGWAYEIKWDGMRVIAFVDSAGEVRLQSVKPRDVTPSYPELWGLARATQGRQAILDGEVVALDETGRPSFSQLQHRMHVVNPAEAARRAAEVPVAYQVFDLLSFDGTDAISLPYLERRRLLAAVVDPGPTWAVASHHVGDGRSLYEVVKGQGLEGLVAKRLDSTYQPGRRSPAWRKVKVRPQQEFVVGGWAPGEGRRRGTMGSLLLGYHDPAGALRYAGRVGTGFTERELDRLTRLLVPLARDTAPFDPLPPRDHRREAHWVEPELIVEVAFGEWTPEGLLRHPSYLGQRDDKDPRDVTRNP